MSSANTPPADADEIEYRGRLQRALGGDFELHELIGRGGFGSVYAAWDKKLERDVAVKALRHDLFPTRPVLERFQREAKAVAKLRHPNILPVYEVGEGDGIAFMIMPIIRGRNLRELMDSRTLTTAEAVRIIADIARALEGAHRVGIVHRDVKPENILLEGDDQHALLTDFGIAKSEGGDGALTGSGVILGSPHYMSPEQASAEKSLDGRSDIYSLGAVAYEALSGRKPYQATSLQQQLVLQFTTEPPPLATITAGLPQPLADAVMRALARDPSARWESAGAFATAISDAVAPAPATDAEPASWFARRGLIVAAIYTVGVWTTVVSIPLLDSAKASKNSGMVTAIGLVLTPLRLFVVLAFLFVLFEFGAAFFAARRERLPWREQRRRLFAQPRWWQAWYPKSLRDPRNAWEQIPLSMKFLKTLLWVDMVAFMLTLPFGFSIRTLASFTAGVGMPLPLPTRLAILASSAAQRPIAYSVLIIVVGLLWLTIARRVSFASVARLMFTWRADDWNTRDGRRLSGID